MYARAYLPKSPVLVTQIKQTVKTLRLQIKACAKYIVVPRESCHCWPTAIRPASRFPAPRCGDVVPKLGAPPKRRLEGRTYQRHSKKERIKDSMMPSNLSGLESLIAHLKSTKCIQTQRTEDVMRQVDRIHFVQHLQSYPGGAQAHAYKDEPMPIGHHQTISAPSMHAICLELLAHQLQPGAHVLDVGSGSGYLTACMALLVAPGGKVRGVEKFAPLAAQSLRNIHMACPDLRINEPDSPVQLHHDNVFKEESLAGSLFDAIHVGAAAAEIPEVLLRHLKAGGRMVIPVGQQHETQKLKVLDKQLDGQVVSRDVLHVRYVPLTKPEEEPAPA